MYFLQELSDLDRGCSVLPTHITRGRCNKDYCCNTFILRAWTSTHELR